MYVDIVNFYRDAYCYSYGFEISFCISRILNLFNIFFCVRKNIFHTRTFCLLTLITQNFNFYVLKLILSFIDSPWLCA